MIILSVDSLLSQNLVKKFFELPCPEKRWVIFHLFKAKKVYQISVKAINETLLLKNDTTLDGDINGGQLDAFRHAYWMALVTQKYGVKFALRLGRVHEKSNYRMYKKGQFEEGILPDYESSEMDFLNNDVGIEIGKNYKCLSENEIKEIIIEQIKLGKLYIIKKDKYGNYLTCDGEKLIISKKQWKTGKCIIPSNLAKK